MRKLTIFITLIWLTRLTPGISHEIHDAAQQGHLDKIKTILAIHPEYIEIQDQAGRRPLHFAANSGYIEIVKYLLSKKADIHAKTKANTTVLHYAALKGSLGIVKLLVEKGVEIDIKNIQIATPMYYAASRGHKEVVQYLIDKGAIVDALDREEGTPLHSAAQAGHVEVVKLLIEKGAEKKKKDTNGLTALHFACTNGNKELVKFLVKNRLKIDDPDNYGKTPIYYGAYRGHKEIVDFLILMNDRNIRNTCLDGCTLMHAAATGGLETFVKRLVRTGLNTNSRDIFGSTPLHFAAKNGHTKTTEVLIEMGADVNVKNSSGQTPYHAAITSGHNETAEIIAIKGASTQAWKFPTLQGDYLGQDKPGSKPELFAPGVISTSERNERDGSFTSDGNEFYFTLWGNNQPWNIMLMQHNHNGWTEPQRASFSGQYLDAEAYFTPDDQKIFFISNRPKRGTGNPGTWEIWHAERNDSGWSEPILLGSPFEGGFYTTFTNNWVMYFTLNDDLHRVRFINGKFGEPEKLGNNVNTSEGEYNAFIARDESYIIFTSVGLSDSYGEGDLYICFRKDDDTWTKAKNMGPRINSFARDYCPSVSPDGKYFFFSSRRYGTEDIFWVDAKIIVELKPEELKKGE